MKQQPTKIFVSYCREDNLVCDRLMTHLTPLDRDLRVAKIFRDSSRIQVGASWDEVIKTELESSDIYLLIISADYFSSEYLAKTELPMIHDMHKIGKQVIPIFASHCSTTSMGWIEGLMGVCSPSEPLVQIGSAEQERAFAKLVTDLNKQASEIMNTSSPPNYYYTPRPQIEGASYNIAVLGKTGVGKSELINYILGADVRDAGTGKPRTTQGFHQTNAIVRGLPVSVYDSWGIELGAAEQWSEILKTELRTRGISAPVSEWFHTVIYCIAAPGSRVEEFEISLVQQLRASGYRVIVALTKADLASDEDIENLSKTIRSELCDPDDIVIIPTCAIGKLLRGGHLTQTFGVEEVTEFVMKGFWRVVIQRLPDKMIGEILDEITKWSNSTSQWINNELGYFNSSTVCAKLEMHKKQFVDELSQSVVREIYARCVNEAVSSYGLVLRIVASPSDSGSFDGWKKQDVSGFESMVDALSNSRYFGAWAALMAGANVAGLALANTGIGLLAIGPIVYYAKQRNKNRINEEFGGFLVLLNNYVMSQKPAFEDSLTHLSRQLSVNTLNAYDQYGNEHRNRAVD